jgi:hypothetical protein
MATQVRDCVQSILRFCDYRDIVRTDQVSKVWLAAGNLHRATIRHRMEMILHSIVYVIDYLKKYPLHFDSTVIDFRVKDLQPLIAAIRGRTFKKVTLSSNLIPEVAQEIWEAVDVSQLEDLTIRGESVYVSDRQNEPFRESIARKIPQATQLKTLHLPIIHSHFRGYDTPATATLLQRIPWSNLTSFRCDSLTDDNLRLIGPQIRTVPLWHLFECDTLPNPPLLYPNLLQTKFVNRILVPCNEPNGAEILRLFMHDRNLSLLTHVDFSACMDMTDETTALFLSFLQQLNYAELTHLGLPCIARVLPVLLPRLPQAQKLHTLILYLKNLSWTQPLLHTCATLPSLQHLIIYSSQNLPTSGTGPSFLKAFPFIQQLTRFRLANIDQNTLGKDFWK